ncbi:TonB-dependent receptor [Pseudooceanicola aestuarii]|uniref:TonB-dependent receptor n=1 Tax=Pseudooceanicola aestuarii TaxID=2697319 RepID=UPI0013D36EB2|nr:TonB-dependent receptor [Pseudooceanicola aestuarii]
MGQFKTITWLAGGISVLAVNAALAQDGDVFALDPVFVYGDRAASEAGQSANSVAVVDAQALDQSTITTYRDAFRTMANVQAGDFVESGFIIRGVNSEGQTPGGLGTPLASYYIDGVQQTVEGTRRGPRSVFDAEQLEVYRGPQSTLSGRSALAGAMYLRTRDPDFSRSGKAYVAYGENNRKSVGLAFGDQLAPNLAYRISGEYFSKDNDLNYPSYRRFDRYGEIATEEYWTLRGKLLWQPAGDDSTNVLLSYSHSYDSPIPDDVAGPSWSTASTGYDARRGDIWGTILPDFYTVAVSEFPAFQDVRKTTVDNVGLEVTHKISDSLTFTAQTGYSHSVTERHSINEGTAGEFLTVDGEFDQTLITQEFRLNHEEPGLRWVAGLYAGQEDQGAFRDATLPNFSTFMPENQYSRNSADLFNLAAFGEVAYEFAPSWTVIAGGRLDYFDQTQTASLTTNGVLTSQTSSSFSDTVFIPKIGLEYALANDDRVSLIYQEGYRPGGSGILAATGAAYTYDAETAKTLELSYRGRALEDRLRFAGNVFFQQWDNQQVEIGSYPDNYVANAGRSESYGAELELEYTASQRLSLYSSIGLLNTEFKDFSAGGINYAGLSFPNAPETTLALGARWGGDTGWFALGNVKFTGASMSRLENGVARPATLEAYTTVDASVGYAWDNGAKLTVYGTNLFDTEYFTYENGPGVLATLGDRREIGVRFDYTF